MSDVKNETSRIEKMEADRTQFLATAKEVYPLLLKIRDAMERNGYTESARICIAVDGYMEFSPYETRWQMSAFSCDPVPKARYEYSEAIPIDEVK